MFRHIVVLYGLSLLIAAGASPHAYADSDPNVEEFRSGILARLLSPPIVFPNAEGAKVVPIGDGAIGDHVPIDAEQLLSPSSACSIDIDKTADVLYFLKQCQDKRFGWLKI